MSLSGSAALVLLALLAACSGSLSVGGSVAPPDAGAGADAGTVDSGTPLTLMLRAGPVAAGSPDGHIYVLGGDDAADLDLGTTPVFEIVDVAARTVTRGPPVPGIPDLCEEPSLTCFIAAAVGPDGRLYVTGNSDPFNEDSPPRSTMPMQVYDPATGLWQAQPATATLDSYSPMVFAPDGRLYAVTGNEVAQSLSAFDPASASWSASISQYDGVALPAAVLSTSGAPWIATVGYDPSVQTALELYTPGAGGSSGQWTRGFALVPPGENQAFALLGGAVYAIGGDNFTSGGSELGGMVYSGHASGNVWSFAVPLDGSTSGSWTAIAPLPTPRTQMAAATAGGKIYALGGMVQSSPTSSTSYSLEFIGTIEEYDPASQTWSALAR